MKIAVDLHGFMDSYPEVLRPMLQFMRHSLGSEIFVLSGPEEQQIIKELENLGYKYNVHYDVVISIVDYLKEKKDPDLHQDENGHWWTTDKKWFSSKGHFCMEMGIQIIFDDKVEYEEYLPAWVDFYQIQRRKK